MERARDPAFMPHGLLVVAVAVAVAVVATTAAAAVAAAQLASAGDGAHRHRLLDPAAAINQREPGEAISALIGLTSPVEPLPAIGQQNNNTTALHLPPPGPNQNQSREANETASVKERDRLLIVGTSVAHTIIFVIGSLGNAVVILVIMKFTKTETVTDIYILNLAFADLMFLTGLIFLVITMLISHWIFGNIMCKLYMASTSLNQFASSLLLVVMSFDRFLAVCHPIYAQRFRRIRTAKVICLTIWIICLILMIPIVTYAKINIEQDTSTCAIAWPDNTGFNCELVFIFYAFSLGFALPLLLIACFYLCVIRRLRLAARNQMSGLASSRRSRSRETTNKRIEHLVIGIIFTYTVCWLPYWTTQLWVSFHQALDRQHSADTSTFYALFLVASCLSYTNSAVNPILYAFLSDNFKRRCSEIIRSVARIRWCPASLAGRHTSGGPRSRASHTTGGQNHDHDGRHPADHREPNSNSHHHHHHYLAANNSHHKGATGSTACYCEPTDALVTSYVDGDCQATSAQLLDDLHLDELRWRKQHREPLEEEEEEDEEGEEEEEEEVVVMEEETEAGFYRDQGNNQFHQVAIREERSDKSRCHGV